MNSIDKATINTLRKEKKPILIYGNMNTALVVYKMLTINNIFPTAFIVDKFAFSKRRHIGKIKILCIDDIKDLYRYNVVIGFDNVEKTKALLSLKKYLNFSVFHLISAGSMFNWTKPFVQNHEMDFFNIRNLLADERSKRTLDALIDTRIGKPKGFEKLLSLSDSNQYFNELTYVCNSEKEIFVDCGAFDGDSITKFASFSNFHYKKIIAFEPLEENYIKLKENTAALPSVSIEKKASWNMDAELSFTANTSASAVSSDGLVKIKATTIDKVVKNQKITFIKMDVEGSEYESLLEAKGTIERNHPKLAICVYHKAEDILVLPKLIQSFKVHYKYYLRNHSNRLSETVLYCIPEK